MGHCSFEFSPCQVFSRRYCVALGAGLSDVSACGARHAARDANTDAVKELRRKAKDLKGGVAVQTLELRLLEKAWQAMGQPPMRYLSPGTQYGQAKSAESGVI